MQEPCQQPELSIEHQAHYLGIDPGTTGAFALVTVRFDGTQGLTVYKTPTVWVACGTGKRRRYDLEHLSELVRQLPAVAVAYLEEQSARPGQGVTSMFSTGYGAGMWAALLTAHHIPYALVRPQRWRSIVGLPSSPRGPARRASCIKEGVQLAAQRRFPEQRIGLDHADAVMLAVAASQERTRETSH